MNRDYAGNRQRIYGRKPGSDVHDIPGGRPALTVFLDESGTGPVPARQAGSPDWSASFVTMPPIGLLCSCIDEVAVHCSI
jgi:hypothetical protein